MFIVIKMFDDLQDSQVVNGIRSYHRYNPGDVYPREGCKPTSERIRSLLSGENALHTPLIAIFKPPETDSVKESPAKDEPETAKKTPAKSPARAKPKRTTGKKPASKQPAARSTRKKE